MFHFTIHLDRHFREKMSSGSPVSGRPVGWWYRSSRMMWLRAQDTAEAQRSHSHVEHVERPLIMAVRFGSTPGKIFKR